jgi:hypothetical protein
MAGQTIPTEEVSDIFFSRTPLVISTADSIKNFAEANTHDLEGYLKLTSALSGFLSIPVGMTQMGSSITTSMYGDVKIGNYSVEKDGSEILGRTYPVPTRQVGASARHKSDNRRL